MKRKRLSNAELKSQADGQRLEQKAREAWASWRRQDTAKRRWVAAPHPDFPITATHGHTTRYWRTQGEADHWLQDRTGPSAEGPGTPE